MPSMIVKPYTMVVAISAVVLGLGLRGERRSCESSRMRRKGEPSYRLLKLHQPGVYGRETRVSVSLRDVILWLAYFVNLTFCTSGTSIYRKW